MSSKVELTYVKRGIFRNTLYNLAGNALPLLVAVFTIPILIRGFGKEEFGILSLAWVLVGYFSLADFGLSRTLTKFVSERIGKGNTDELPAVIWTALALMTILGVIGASLLAMLSPVLVTSILRIDRTNIKEILDSFYVLSIGIPFTITAAGLRGILEALMRFDLSNYVRIALGVFNFVGPALVLLFSKNIMFAVIILVVSRIICLFAYLVICFDVLPEMKKHIIFHKSQVVPLLRYGGWITVSNVVAPIMVNFDRFFVGAMVSVSALVYYSTPWEVVARLLIIPTSLAGVVFPLFSQLKGAENASNSGLYYRSLKYVLLIMFPFCLICTVFAKEILQIWLGHEFAINSFHIMQIMGVAVMLNGMATIPFSLIQAAGRPDITAKLHLIEVAIYVPMLFLLINEWGLLGAALAWLLRVALDLLMLIYYSNKSILRRYAKDKNIDKFAAEHALFVLLVLIISPAFIKDFAIRLFASILALIAFVPISWKGLLGSQEKKFVADKLRWNSN